MADERNYTVTLSQAQLVQLDGFRGTLTRRRALLNLVNDALNKVFPAADATPEEVLKLIPVGPRGYPAPGDSHPSVAEMAPYVPFPFPPPPSPGSPPRWSAWRAAWAGYMENAGWPWEEIATALGYPSMSIAKSAANRHTAQYGEKAAIERRTEMRERMSRYRDFAMDKLENPPRMFTVTGTPVREPDGSHAVDHDKQIRYLDVLLKIEERTARLDASDPKDAQKLAAGDVEYVGRINSLIEQIRVAREAAIAGEVGPVIAGEIEQPVQEEPGQED